VVYDVLNLLAVEVRYADTAYQSFVDALLQRLATSFTTTYDCLVTEVHECDQLPTAQGCTRKLGDKGDELTRLQFNVLSIDYVHVTNCFYDYDYTPARVGSL